MMIPRVPDRDDGKVTEQGGLLQPDPFQAQCLAATRLWFGVDDSKKI